MVKISELTNDSSITGAEQVPINDGWTTKKATVNDILAKQHNHTASDVTDFDTEVSNNTTVTTLVTDLNTAEWTIATHTTDIAGKLWKTELRTGLTADQIMTTNGSGVEGYSALSLLPVVASNAEYITGTDTTKYVNSAQAWFNIVSWQILLSSSDWAVFASAWAYAKMRDTEVSLAWTYNVQFTLSTWSGTGIYWRIYVNGSAVWTERNIGASSTATYNQDITVSASDNIQIYAYATWSINSPTVTNFRIYYWVKPKLLTATVVS